MRQRGWSVPKLLVESGLQCDRTSLQRKLRGTQKLYADEIQKLVNTLGAIVAVVPEAA